MTVFPFDAGLGVVASSPVTELEASALSVNATPKAMADIDHFFVVFFERRVRMEYLILKRHYNNLVETIKLNQLEYLSIRLSMLVSFYFMSIGTIILACLRFVVLKIFYRILHIVKNTIRCYLLYNRLVCRMHPYTI